jgi:hypothetical protein
MVDNPWLERQIRLRTIHGHPHVVDQSVDDLESLRCGYPRLILDEPIQPPHDYLDFILS